SKGARPVPRAESRDVKAETVRADRLVADGRQTRIARCGHGSLFAKGGGAAQKKAGARRSRAPISICWIRRLTSSVKRLTRMRSSAAFGPYDDQSKGSPNSILHLLGSRTSPRRPRPGKVGVIGKYGSPTWRASPSQPPRS